MTTHQHALYAPHAECSPAITDGLVMSHADCPLCAVAMRRLHYPGVAGYLDQLRVRVAVQDRRAA